MDINWCLHCARPLPPPTHPTRNPAFCSPACEASDALSPYTSPAHSSSAHGQHVMGGTIIPSLLRTHHRSPSYPQPPSPTARRGPRPSFLSDRPPAPGMDDAVSLSSTSSASSASPPRSYPLYTQHRPPPHPHQPHQPPRKLPRGMPPTPSTSPSHTRRGPPPSAQDKALSDLAHQLGSVLLTPPASADYGRGHGRGFPPPGGAEEEFEAYGRGHDRAYYAGRERYRPRAEGWEVQPEEREERVGPIAIVGKMTDLEYRKRWEEAREVGSYDEEEEEGREASRRTHHVRVREQEREGRRERRPREGDREGRERERERRTTGDERGRGRERRRG